MPARAISAGTISFGLVSIPVKVFTATGAKSIRFNMLHERDKSRLKQKYTCTTCGEEVERGATVRGYEYAREQYVVVTDDELKALQVKGDQAIEIEEFVPIEKVDPIYFERSQLLGPDKGGQKAYRLLRDAMTESGKVAIGRFSTRGRQQLVLLRAARGGLMMHGLFYADEVRDFADIEIDEEIHIKDNELTLANQLIDQLTREVFDPRKYEDEYRQAILEAVDRKVAGEDVVVMPKTEQREQIIDLVAALKQSLDEKKAASAEQPRQAGAAKAPKRKASG